MTAGPLRMRRLRRLLLVLALPLVLALAFAPGALATGPPGSYTTSVFSDGFESGSLIGWDGLLGNGSATVIPGAAHTGTFGLEMSNGPQQFQVAVKSFPSTYADSSTSFWVRLAAGSGFQMVAQARDSTSSAHMWDLAYDGGQTHLLPLSVQRDRQHGDRDRRRDSAGQTRGSTSRSSTRPPRRAARASTSTTRRSRAGASRATTRAPRTCSASSSGTTARTSPTSTTSTSGRLRLRRPSRALQRASPESRVTAPSR